MAGVGCGDHLPAAPGLAGFFTITASENLTNCWSHGQGKGCPRCGKRAPAEVMPRSMRPSMRASGGPAAGRR